MLFLYLNVGGSRYRLKEQTIWNRNDNSLLLKFSKADHGKRVLMCDAYFEAENEYFFERPANLFNLIFDYYITGLVTAPADLPRERVLEEFRYWEINLDQFYLSSEQPFHAETSDHTCARYASDPFVDAVCCFNCRRNAHDFFNRPCSGILAFVYHTLMVALVLGSVAVLAYRAEPAVVGNKRMTFVVSRHSNSSVLIVSAIEFWIMLVFALDLIGRFSVHPSKGLFLRDALVTIDMFTVVTYISWAVLSRLTHESDGWLQLFMLLMSVRVLKLARYSSDMRRMGITLLISRSAIMAAFLLISAGGTVFTFAFLWAEAENRNTLFTNYPSTLWYSVQTMTTLGYDIAAPSTNYGRIIATCATLYGIACISCTISTVVKNFMQLSEQDARLQQANNYNCIKRSPSMHRLDRMTHL